METAVKIISSHEIPQSELRAVLEQAGAARSDSPYYDYVLTRGSDVARVYLKVIEIPDPERDALISAKLGSAPATRLLLEMGKTPGSVQLAVDLCCRVAERWPCVFDDLSASTDPIYTAQELLEMRRQGRGFGRGEVKSPTEADSLADETIGSYHQKKSQQKSAENPPS